MASITYYICLPNVSLCKCCPVYKILLLMSHHFFHKCLSVQYLCTKNTSISTVLKPSRKRVLGKRQVNWTKKGTARETEKILSMIKHLPAELNNHRMATRVAIFEKENCKSEHNHTSLRIHTD